MTLDNKWHGAVILVELSKAFDTLNHDLLIAKLNVYVFDKNWLTLIESDQNK